MKLSKPYLMPGLLLLCFLTQWIVSVPSVYAAGGIFYVVRRGEYLASIAARYRISLRVLASYNGLVNANQIYPGRVLRIPLKGSQVTGPLSSLPAVTSVAPPMWVPGQASCNTYYVVQPGDSPSRVAARCGTTIASLMQTNGLRSSYLYTGQRLNVWHGAVLSTVEPTPVANPAGSAGSSNSHLDQSLASPPTAPGTYYIRPGDTLAGIATRFGVEPPTLMSANGISSGYIYVGQRLTLPSPSVHAIPSGLDVSPTPESGISERLYMYPDPP